jgi:hypothetical protein
MTGRGARIRRVAPVVVPGFSQDLNRAAPPFALDTAREDLVRILSRLTQDVERFEWMVEHEWHLLQQHAAQRVAFEDDEIRNPSRRISAGAAELAASARAALEELQRLPWVTELAPLETREHHYAGGLSGDQPLR